MSTIFFELPFGPIYQGNWNFRKYDFFRGSDMAKVGANWLQL